jgi:ferredoxin-type protein NapH
MTHPAARAVAVKGHLGAAKWLVARRLSQGLALALFLSGPLAGVWVLRGSLGSSEVLGTVPFTDPLILAQSLLAGHAATAWLGAALVVGLYAVVGGRAYCAWLCPVNPLTDGAHWLRVRLGLKGGASVSRSLRWWGLGAVLVVSTLAGTVVWETVNPVTLLHRGLVLGGLVVGSAAWMVVAAVVLLDLFVSNRAWCGHLCPVGAAYGVIGKASLLRVSARGRAACDDCLACFHVCPEPHVLRPALRGRPGTSPVVLSGDCTNCGRCIDVCHAGVFAFTHRFDVRTAAPAAPAAGHHSQGESPPCAT